MPSVPGQDELRNEHITKINKEGRKKRRVEKIKMEGRREKWREGQNLS